MSEDPEVLCPNGCPVKESQLPVVEQDHTELCATGVRNARGDSANERLQFLLLFHLDDQTIYRVLKALAEGNGIRATARIFDIDRKTVELILEQAASPCQKVSANLISDYHLKECRLDEFWSFVKKRKHVCQC